VVGWLEWMLILHGAWVRILVFGFLGFIFFNPFFPGFLRIGLSWRHCRPTTRAFHRHSITTVISTDRRRRSSLWLFMFVGYSCLQSTLTHLFAEHHRRLFMFAGWWCVSAAASMNPQQVSFIFCSWSVEENQIGMKLFAVEFVEINLGICNCICGWICSCRGICL